MCQIAPSYRLDFLYDENDELYGFIKDGSSKYFYVRDSLQNIRGIIDSNGKFVVKYNCSAYGNVSVLQDTNGLAAINPFLYKGYYFDKESGMFYCHTRYYVPEWCRWLKADHIAYIRPQNANQMNLFAYCQNDPVNNVDPTGSFWIAAILLISTAIGATIGSVKAYKKAKKEGKTGKDLAWQTIKGTLIGGAFGLAAGGAIVATGAVIAGAAGTIAGASLSGITFLGVQATKAFAIGALAFDFTAFVVAPLIGVTMDGIEIGGTPKDPTPKPGEGPIHPAYRY